MIDKLQLKNFKCFEQMDINMKNVNVFTGVNGMGKSTVIQSLLLLQQSHLTDKGNKGLYLNGKYINLGNSQDVVYDKALDDEIEINYMTNEGKWHRNHFLFAQDTNFLPCMNEQMDGAPLAENKFVYLSAYRIQPLERYAVIDERELKNHHFGNNGEFALQYLSAYADTSLKNRHVIIKDERGETLIHQTRIWLDRVSPGVSPQIKVIMENRSSELSFDFVEGKEKTNSYKSINVGFGITYVLPVVVALLTAEKGDLVIIENPEAHIHPAGQRMLGELIARAGAGGVQILVETHSEHIVNGIRISVKEKQIAKDDVLIAFFYKDEEDEYRHTYTSLRISEDGKMNRWPKGFFDESVDTENDNRIFEFRHSY